MICSLGMTRGYLSVISPALSDQPSDHAPHHISISPKSSTMDRFPSSEQWISRRLFSYMWPCEITSLFHTFASSTDDLPRSRGPRIAR
jgi:hypothetical protein